MVIDRRGNPPGTESGLQALRAKYSRRCRPGDGGMETTRQARSSTLFDPTAFAMREYWVIWLAFSALRSSRVSVS